MWVQFGYYDFEIGDFVYFITPRREIRKYIKHSLGEKISVRSFIKTVTRAKIERMFETGIVVRHRIYG